MKKYLIITGDENDADYKSERTEVSEKDIEFIKPLIEAIRDFSPYVNKSRKHHHNFPNSEYVRDDLGEKSAQELYGHLDSYAQFEEMCPCNIHTITDVRVLTVMKEEKLF